MSINSLGSFPPSLFTNIGGINNPTIANPTPPPVIAAPPPTLTGFSSLSAQPNPLQQLIPLLMMLLQALGGGGGANAFASVLPPTINAPKDATGSVTGDGDAADGNPADLGATGKVGGDGDAADTNAGRTGGDGDAADGGA